MMSDDVLGRAFTALLLLRDVPVLAEHAAQIAQAEENRPRAVPAAQTILLAEVGEGAGDDSVAPGVADQSLVLEPVDVAVARAGTAVGQFGERRFGSRAELPTAGQLDIGRLEVVDQEPGIDPGGKCCSKHDRVGLDGSRGAESAPPIGLIRQLRGAAV